jgi:hypothetical protein
VQKKFIQDQEQEKKRVNVRFDEELVKLKQLWAMREAPSGPGRQELNHRAVARRYLKPPVFSSAAR